MIDITDVILHTKKMKTKSIFIYIFIIEFKQIRFSSEVSLMYNGIRGFKREEEQEDHSD